MLPLIAKKAYQLWRLFLVGGGCQGQQFSADFIRNTPLITGPGGSQKLHFRAGPCISSVLSALPACHKIYNLMYRLVKLFLGQASNEDVNTVDEK